MEWNGDGMEWNGDGIEWNAWNGMHGMKWVMNEIGWKWN
jgi:hypothetical protein